MQARYVATVTPLGVGAPCALPSVLVALLGMKDAGTID